MLQKDVKSKDLLVSIPLDPPLAPSNRTKKLSNTLTWRNVGFSVPVKKTKTEKVILSECSGEVCSGQVVAIMGGSGAGKSTLLNILSGRLGKGKLSGEILVNGAKRDPGKWKTQCAFVEQDDLLFKNLTVTETLRYSAMLRLPRAVSLAEKRQRVEQIIMQLGLNSCRDTKIGDAQNKGISGGERKRVSIGVELITEPDILFLDEPTSGLDAFNAFNVIENLKNLAIVQNKIIILTIHQPRTDILELFDKIVLLSIGKPVWFGTTADALDHFESLGFPIPPKTNPSDFFIDIVTIDQRSDDLYQKSKERINRFIDSWKRISEDLFLPVQPLVNSSKATRAFWPSSWFGELGILFSRNIKEVMRDYGLIGATLGQALILTLLMGALFWHVNNTQGGIQNRLGVLFFVVVNQTFGVVMPIINVLPLQRDIIKRERTSGTYRASSAFIAKFLSSLPLAYLGSLLLTIPVYWMVGLQNDVAKFFIFQAVVLVHTHTANAMGLMIGAAVPNVQVGQIIGSSIIAIMLIFGGMLLNLDEVSPAIGWLQYISIVAYSMKALAQNEFIGLTFECFPGQPACTSTGEQVLANFAINNMSIEKAVLINFAISVGFTILGYLFFSRTSKPSIRLE